MVLTKLSDRQLDQLIRLRIAEALAEAMDDPDRGYMLQLAFRRRLRRSLREKERGALRSFNEIQKRLR